MHDHRALDGEAERVLRGERECLAGVDHRGDGDAADWSDIGAEVLGAVASRPYKQGGALHWVGYRAQGMNDTFRVHVESLHPSFERLMAMRHVNVCSLPTGMPTWHLSFSGRPSSPDVGHESLRIAYKNIAGEVLRTIVRPSHSSLLERRPVRLAQATRSMARAPSLGRTRPSMPRSSRRRSDSAPWRSVSSRNAIPFGRRCSKFMLRDCTPDTAQ